MRRGISNEVPWRVRAIGFLDSIFGEEPESPKNQALKYWNKVLSPFFNSAKSESDALFASAQGTQRDVFNLLGEGFTNARANVAQQGRMGMQGIMDAQTQALAGGQQAALSAGFSGGTPHMTMNRGIASDTSRAIGNLQAQLAQLYSGLDVGQAQAQGQALQGLGGIQQNQAGAAQNFLGLQFSGVNQTPYQVGPQGGYGEEIGALASIAGIFL